MSTKASQHNKQLNILVVVAHPDDETIGMGGTIARHAEEGANVSVISMTNGVGARHQADEEAIDKRRLAATAASQVLGFEWVAMGDFPDNALDTIPLLEIIKFVEQTKFRTKFDIVYTHSSADLNVDHRIVNQAAITAFRPQPNECWTEIRTFETSSATDFGHVAVTNSFLPNLYVNIENFLATKLEALKKYEMELRQPPHTRSIEGIEYLAKYRGFSVGLNSAEAFEIIRKIER